jgi:hypothetical protein
VAGVDMNHLADIALGLGPMQFVTPRFIHSRYLFRHVILPKKSMRVI